MASIASFLGKGLLFIMLNNQKEIKEESIWDDIDEGEEKLTLTLKFERFFYRRGECIKNAFRYIKYTFQKTTRHHHTSDIELWNLDGALAKYLYKKIKAFRDMKRNGYPSYFSEYCENEWKSKGDYEKAIYEGKIGGGGSEAWDKTLDHILMALEYTVYVKDIFGEKKRANEWYEKNGFKNPHAKIPENLQVYYEYRMTPAYLKEQEDDDPRLKEFGGLDLWCLSDESDLHIKSPEKYELMKERCHYYDVHYDVNVIEAKVTEGYKLLGRFFQDLWD